MHVSQMFNSKMCLYYLIFFLFIPDGLYSLPLSPETIPQDYPIWLAIERVLPSPEGEGDAILIRPELCNRPCAELIGSDAEQIPRTRCVCRCPPRQPVFVQQQKMRGQCSQKIEDCPGRSIFFEHPQNAHPQFVPAISLPQSGEPIGEELRIAWKESGVKVRQSQGPRCSIQSVKLLGKHSEWRALEAQKLFEPGWKEGNGRILWIGSDSDAQQLAGSIINIELECVAGKNGNSTFCLSFRIEGQIEAAGGVGKAPPGQIGIELERGRRAEVVVIILLAILLFLSLFGSIFMWNVCWRMHKRKLVHSLQMQFVHFARQEKEKAISECQLRYQALVKAAAGIRNAEEGQSFNVGYTNNGGIGPSNLMENGGEIIQGGQQQQQQNGRRKLYFSSDFFEPKLMSSPSPMAEQFLYDLRKMITCARERIRTRRHVPRLPPVVESEDEGPGIGGNVVGESAKSEEIVSEKEKMKMQTNEEEKPKMDELKEEEDGKRTTEEIALRMEEIVPAEQWREEIHRRNNGKEEEENKEKDPSPRSSMDSGRGSEKREEEEIYEQKPKEENGMEEEVAKEEHKNKEKDEEFESTEKMNNENGNEEQEKEGKMVDDELVETKEDQILGNVSIQQPFSRIPVGIGTASTSSNSKSNSRLQFTAFCRRAPPLPPRPPPPPPPSSDAAEGKMMEVAIEGKPKCHHNPVAAMKRRIASSNNERKETKSQQQPSSIPVGHFYAVCPPPSFACSDRMKKSLPRRKKAIVPITTNSSAAVLPKATPTAV